MHSLLVNSLKSLSYHPQVYIVAMNQEREKQRTQPTPTMEEEDDLAGGGSSGESLLSLVQPEMKTLSKQWLAALKDHALLSLPAGRLRGCSSVT